MKKVGRPLKFKTVEELSEKIEAYFNSNQEVYTVGDLAVWLDVDRRTITNYEDKDEFFPTIKRAKGKIEADVEKQALLGKLNPTVSIFNLKNNFNWKDRQEIDSNVNVNNYKELSVEELKKLAGE